MVLLEDVGDVEDLDEESDEDKDYLGREWGAFLTLSPIASGIDDNSIVPSLDDPSAFAAHFTGVGLRALRFLASSITKITLTKLTSKHSH